MQRILDAAPLLPFTCIVLLIGISFSSTFVHADILITEIFPNPIADETLNEWIELYNNGTENVDVSNWMIGDDKDNDTIEGGLYDKEGTIIPDHGYAIITDEATRVYNNFNVSEEAIRLYVDDSSIGNGLGNDGETLYVYDGGGDLVSTVLYDEIDEGNSYALVGEEFLELSPTPGYPNNGSTTFVISDDCDWQVVYILNDTVFSTDDFEFRVRATKLYGDSTNISGSAYIRDVNGNIIKEYSLWNSEKVTSRKTSNTYTPNLKNAFYLLRTNVSVECADTDPDNNEAQEILTIQKEGFQESELEILNVLDLGSDKEAEFGQQIRVRLRVYKGNTTKKNVKVYVERGDKVSKTASVNLPDKYTEYELTIPVQLKDNCGDDFDEGKYDIKVEGLDTDAEDEVEITNDEGDCPQAPEAKRQKYVYELTEFSPTIIDTSNIKLHIENNDDEDHDFRVWSYIYRGSKSYSGNRESNLQQLTIKKESSSTVALQNSIVEALPGDYKLKVRILRDTLKTPTEITKDVTILGGNPGTATVVQSIVNSSPPSVSFDQPIITGDVIYESTSLRALQLAPYFFVGVLILLIIVLVWKRW